VVRLPQPQLSSRFGGSFGTLLHASIGAVDYAGGSGDTAAVLESQVFVFGGSTVSEVLQKASQATGAPVHVAGFIRFVRGEGVVKPARPSFADEVRQQLA
ncbi:hypothetical protein LPJ54_007036, partial [Coemansia sp. RSA 1824]